MRVLMVTSEWPTTDNPGSGVFVARQARYLQEVGVDVDVFTFRGSKNPFSYLRAWSKIQARLTRERYDLVHAQWGQSSLPALPKRLPLVVTLRGSDVVGYVGDQPWDVLVGRLLRASSGIVARVADEVILVSERLARFLDISNCHVIPSGIDLEQFRPIPQREARLKLALPEDRSLVLFCGSPTNPIKRYDLAVETMKHLNGRLPTELVVCEATPYDLMPYYMNACDALLLTSTHEGSPNVVKEALACNLPVVSVDVGDVRERIGSIPGCVVSHDDRADTLASGLAEVLVRDRRIDGRSSVANLDEKFLAQRVVCVYRSAISKGRRRDESGHEASLR